MVFTFSLPPQIRLVKSGFTQSHPHGIVDTAPLWMLDSQDAMVRLEPLQPSWSVADVLGTKELFAGMFETLMARLQWTKEDRWSLVLEGKYGQELDTFLGKLVDGADPVPGLSHMVLLVIERDVVAHLLLLLLYILVGVYYMARWLFALEDKHSGKTSLRSREFSCWGITFVPLDSIA